MHRRRTPLPLVACLVALGAPAQAVLHVPGQFATVQAALDAAATGDTVLVAPGTWSGPITFPARGIVLRGAGADVTTLTTTTFDPVVTFAIGGTQAAVIEGFTIRGGNGFDAGGIYCNRSSPTIRNNSIVQNRTSARGGGIGVYFGSPRIEGNRIAENSQSFGQVSGGGISLLGAGNAVIVGNLIENNLALNGGGICCNSAGTPRIEGNRIRGNSATWGGGVAFSNASDAVLVQNVIDGNTGNYGGGIYYANGAIVLVNNTIVGNLGSAIHAYRPPVAITLVNNLMTSSGTLLYGELWRPEITHVFANNLLFAPTVYGGDWPDTGSANGTILADPHLRPDGLHLSAASPARDAGQLRAELPATDWFGDPRVLGNAVDLGADEYSGTFPFGRACYGLASAPEIRADGQSQLGNQAFGFLLRGGVVGGSGLLVVGDSTTTWRGEPLPRGLQTYGLPVCLQLISGLYSAMADCDATGGARVACPVPAAPFLLGCVLHAQWGTLSAPVGAPSSLDGVSGGLSFEVF